MGGEHRPRQVRVMERIQEGQDIFTLRLQYSDECGGQPFVFAPGQFNMLYLHGVGEVPISIVSDPEDDCFFDHTIRALGRVTWGLSQLREGDVLGVRGPFGQGWPLAGAEGRDVVQLFDRVEFSSANAAAMLCGPEIMMKFSVDALMQRRFGAEAIWVSMERNMQCANGLCGHCQLGPLFVCRDGPVFRYDRVAEWFFRKGF